MVSRDFPQNQGESWATYHRLGGAILSPNLGRVCPVSGIVYSAPRVGLNFTLNMSNPSRDWLTKNGAILETQRSPGFSQNLGKSRAAYHILADPFLLANHGEICHILGIVSSPPLQARDFALNMSNG